MTPATTPRNAIVIAMSVPAWSSSGRIEDVKFVEGFMATYPRGRAVRSDKMIANKIINNAIFSRNTAQVRFLCGSSSHPNKMIVCNQK